MKSSRIPARPSNCGGITPELFSVVVGEKVLFDNPRERGFFSANYPGDVTWIYNNDHLAVGFVGNRPTRVIVCGGFKHPPGVIYIGVG